MLDTPFPAWPSFTEEEIAAVAAVLASNRVNYWTGSESAAFEREFASWSGTKYAIALANGTVALDLALHGLGIGSSNGGSAQDEVIVTPRTFLASISSVVNAGARPVFCDVDRDSGNICAATIEPVLSERTRCILPVHLAGWPCDLDPILRLADERGIAVVEDCAQAHGALYKGRPVGSIGQVGAWSFCQDKIMTTGGEGGMVTCSDHDLWQRMWSFKDHGKSWDAVHARNHAPGFRWVHESFGTNWRITEMQSAVGRIQLRRMDEWAAARARNAQHLRTSLSGHAGTDGPIRLPECSQPGSRHAYYKLYAYVRPENLAPGWDRDRIIAEVVAQGVPVYHGSCSEAYLEKAFEGTGLAPPSRLPVARELGETSMMFLVHPTLRQEDLDRTAQITGQVLERAAR